MTLTGFLVYRNLHFFPQFAGIGKVLLSACGMALALYFLSGAPFVVAGSVSLVVYAGLLWTTRAISSDEVMSLFSKGEDDLAEIPVSP